jgi:hypothetical protein
LDKVTLMGLFGLELWIFRGKVQLDRMSYWGVPELPAVVLMSGSCDLRP